jgi:hypothetical protein
VLPLRGAMAALHARIDACCREAAAIERAQEEHRTDPARLAGLAEALEVNRAEREALRVALLHQAPRCWAEALILAQHVSAALADCHGTVGGALRIAGESLFDFLATAVDEDHEPLGERFQLATVRAMRRRRFRTGEVEG